MWRSPRTQCLRIWDVAGPSRWGASAHSQWLLAHSPRLLTPHAGGRSPVPGLSHRIPFQVPDVCLGVLAVATASEDRSQREPWAWE